MWKTGYLSSFFFFLLVLLLPLHPSEAGVVSLGLQQALQSLSPDEDVPVIINLVDKADLSLIKDENKHARRMKIVKALKDKADLTQGQLRAFLQGRGSKRLTDFWIFNGMATTIPAGMVSDVANFPGVESVTLDYTIQASPVTLGTPAPPEWNITTIKAPDLWSLGYTGTGAVVANADTGVDLNHADLQSKWCGGTNSWFNPYSDPANSAYCAVPNHCTPCELNSATPCDTNGHGTGTMGIMVGGSAGGTAIGVAPDSKWIAVKIFNDLPPPSGPLATDSIIHQAFEWILALPADEAPDVVNNSWGFPVPNVCDTTFQADIQALRTAGIAVVFAAGNAPADQSPANNPGAFAVGATDNTNTVASFSSRGPSFCDGSIFPHVVAPGVNIRTTDISSGGVPQYWTVSGTSFSAPHAAGAMALLLSAFPTLTVSQVESILENTTNPVVGAPLPNNNYGYGLIDALSAYESTFSTIKGNIPEIVISPSSFDFGEVQVSTTVSNAFTITNRGVASLSITGISITGPNSSEFVKQSTGDTCSGQTIPAVSSCNVSVIFSPTSVGPKTATLSIQTNDPVQPGLDVPLTASVFALIPGGAASAPAVAWNSAANQFQIAVRGANNRIYVSTATASGVLNNDWVQLPTGSTSMAPAIAWNPGTGPGTGKVQIAVKGNTSNRIYVANVSADGTVFSGWTQLPSGNTPVSPAITWNAATGRVQMAVKGSTNNRIYVANVSADGTVFSGWTQVPAGVSTDSPAIAIGSVAGMLNVFARDSSGNIVEYTTTY